MLNLLVFLAISNITLLALAAIQTMRIRELSKAVSGFRRAEVLRFKDIVDEAWGEERDGTHWMDDWCADCKKMWGLMSCSEDCMRCCGAKEQNKHPPGFERREVRFY